jgi:hypothetical protein
MWRMWQIEVVTASSKRSSRAEDLWDLKLKEHIAAQHVHWKLYYANRNLSMNELEKVLTIIPSFFLQKIRIQNPS